MSVGRIKPLLFAMLGAALAACSSTGPTPQAPVVAENRLVLTPVSFSNLSGWSADSVADALVPLKRSCDKIRALPESRLMGSDGRFGKAADWYAPCGALRSVPAGNHQAARAYFEQWFEAFRASAGNQPEGLFTGYYEAELHGSRQRSERYRIPLYTRPPGMVANPVPPYFTREQIESGMLEEKVPELLWVDDPVDAHILSIQGSGKVYMNDGKVVHVGYNGNNGRPFVGLGKILLDHGKLSPGNTTMQAVRSWLKAHPVEAKSLMAENPRYVFFRIIGGEGPVGAAGIPLTPGRSIAVDTAFVGLGTPLWLVTNEPDGTPMRRLMIAQDTGAAIKGPVRGDIFWGAGEAALEKAGRMKSRGGYYLLLPKWRSVPVAMGNE